MTQPLNFQKMKQYFHGLNFLLLNKQPKKINQNKNEDDKIINILWKIIKSVLKNKETKCAVN